MTLSFVLCTCHVIGVAVVVVVIVISPAVVVPSSVRRRCTLIGVDIVDEVCESLRSSTLVSGVNVAAILRPAYRNGITFSYCLLLSLLPPPLASCRMRTEK